MEIEKAAKYIEESFLKEILKDSDVTDISFNGEYIYFQHNFFGRMRSDILINQNEARDFIRQIANLTEQQFSYQIPIIDVSCGKYRINAIHQSVGRVFNKQALTFSIRISSIEPKITDESGFLTKPLIVLFEILIKSHCSIVIGGTTGTGKTEFQRYLLRKMDSKDRVIIIDNVLELDQIRYESPSDINSWQVDDRNKYSNIQTLVKNALRSNPDWLIVAESRGEEMVDVFNSVLTGHPIITTIHAPNLESMPLRIARMMMMSDKRTDFSRLLDDINEQIHFYVYLKKDIQKDDSICRYIDEIGWIGKNGIKQIIYSYNNGKRSHYRLSEESLGSLKLTGGEPNVFRKAFLKDE